MHFKYIGLPFQDWHSPRSCAAPIIAVGGGASTTRTSAAQTGCRGRQPLPMLYIQISSESSGVNLSLQASRRVWYNKWKGAGANFHKANTLTAKEYAYDIKNRIRIW